MEEALLARFGTLRSAPANMLLCHDNGVVFGSRQYRAVVGDYGLKQEYITHTLRGKMACASVSSKPSKKSSVGATASNPSNKPDSNSVPGSTTTTITGPIRHSNTNHLTNTTNTYANQQPK